MNMQKLVFIVDDNDSNLAAAATVLENKYRVLTIPSAMKMFSLLEKMQPDIILLDVEMPEMNGFEALKKLKSSSKHADIPVIFLTGLSDVGSEAYGIDLGAVDFIMKPFSEPVLLNRIKNHLHIDELIRERTSQLQERSAQLAVQSDQLVERTKQLERIKHGIVFTLSNLVENRDENTGGHIERTVRHMKILLDEMIAKEVYVNEMSDWNIAALVASAPMHDLGKIVIPDSILNKPGPLSSAEFDTMKSHATEGKRVIEEIINLTGDSDFLQYAKLIAAHHHERWNGEGYPNGLKGTDIPLQGRIMAIIDVYDALVYERPYKEAFDHEKAVGIIMDESGSHFDPQIAEVFLGANEKMLAARTVTGN